MSKIIIDKQVLENWIKYIDTFPLYPEDRVKLQSILQQGEEYNENEAIEFLKYYLKYMGTTVSGFDFEKLFKLYKDERNTKK